MKEVSKRGMRVELTDDEWATIQVAVQSQERNYRELAATEDPECGAGYWKNQLKALQNISKKFDDAYKR